MTMPRVAVSPWYRSLATANGTRLALIPAVAFLTLAFFVPIGMLLWQSLSEPSIGLDNYRRTLGDPGVIEIVVRTFRTAVLVTVITLLLGYPYAYVMTSIQARWRTIMLIVLLAPFWMSVMARSFAWIAILQYNGVLNWVMNIVGLPKTRLLGTETGVLIGMVQVLLPFTVMPLYATLRTIDKSLMKAAEGLGATRIQAFRIVYLPLSAPGAMAACLLTFVLSLGFYVTPDLLGSPDNSLIAQLIAVRVSTLLDFQSAGALGATLLVTTLLILSIGLRLSRNVATIAVKDK